MGRFVATLVFDTLAVVGNCTGMDVSFCHMYLAFSSDLFAFSMSATKWIVSSPISVDCRLKGSIIHMYSI